MSVRLFENNEVIGVVDYTDNLDYWDGNNYTCGATGVHLGIGKLKDGRFYLCHGTQWAGQRDYAEVIDVDTAKEVVLKHDPDLYEEMFGEELPNLTE